MKHIFALATIALLLYIVALPVQAAPTTPANNQQGEVKSIISIGEFFTDFLRKVAPPPPEAKTDVIGNCSDTLSSITGTPDIKNAHRATGKDIECLQAQEGGGPQFKPTLQKTLTGLPWPPSGPITTTLKPIAKIAAALPGFTQSSDSPRQDYTNIRAYLQKDSYPLLVEKERYALLANDRSYILNTADVLSRMRSYSTVTDKGETKVTSDYYREKFLQTVIRGYAFSEKVEGKVGLRHEDRLNYVISNDILLGFLHSKCVANKTCGLDSYKTDTAFSTPPLKVEGEIPFYGIFLACHLGITVDDMPGIAERVCEIVVGPEYRQGKMAAKGLLAEQLKSTGAIENVHFITSCGKDCEWATAAGEGSTGSLHDTSKNPVNGDRVGPELPEAQAGPMTCEKNSNAVVAVINAIGDDPHNTAPCKTNSGPVVLRLTDIKARTSVEDVEGYAMRLLGQPGLFPPNTIIILGNELNNLDPVEWENPSQDVGEAAEQYAELFIAFSNKLRGAGYRIAPAAPDLYNANPNYNPAKWVSGFANRIQAHGACDLIDVLIANVFNVTPQIPGKDWKTTYQYLEENICPGQKQVKHFEGWGADPHASIADQVKFLDETALPGSVETATTLIADNCGGYGANQAGQAASTKPWLYYIPKQGVFTADGKPRAINCSEKEPSDKPADKVEYNAEMAKLRGVFDNVPAILPGSGFIEPSIEVKEKISFTAEDEGRKEEPRESRWTWPGGISFAHAALRELQFLSSPLALVEQCKNVHQGVDANVDNAVKAVNGEETTSDSMGKAEFDNKEFGVTATPEEIKNANVRLETTYDPTTGKTYSREVADVTIKRDYTILTSAHRMVREMLRETTHKMCGVANMFMIPEIAERFHDPELNNGTEVAQAPTDTRSFSCGGDASCNYPRAKLTQVGGINAAIDPYLEESGGKIRQTDTQGMMPVTTKIWEPDKESNDNKTTETNTICKVADSAKENLEAVNGSSIITDGVIALANEVSKRTCVPAKLIIGLLAKESRGLTLVNGIDTPASGDPNQQICRTFACLTNSGGALGAFSYTRSDFEARISDSEIKPLYDSCVAGLTVQLNDGAHTLTAPADSRIMGHAMCVFVASIQRDLHRNGAPACTAGGSAISLDDPAVDKALLIHCAPGAVIPGNEWEAYCQSALQSFRKAIDLYSDNVDAALKSCKQ